MTRRLLTILLVLVSTTAQAAPDLSCWLKNNKNSVLKWPSSRTIPVFVSVNSVEGVQTIGYTPSFVDRSTQIAIGRLNEQGGATIRLRWAGESAMSTSSSALQNAIVITGNPGCSSKSGSGIPKANNKGVTFQGIVTLWKGNSSASCSPWSTPLQAEPEVFVDLLVHEIEHTLGRSDAYTFSTGLCDTDACGSSHATTMCSIAQDLTSFDRSDEQAVYGSRASTSTLMRRTTQPPYNYWNSIMNEGANYWDVAPGPGASYEFPEIPVAMVHLLLNGAVEIIQDDYNYFGDVTFSNTDSSAYDLRKPVSSAFASNGGGVMAYIAEDLSDHGAPRRLCYRMHYGLSWQAETCEAGCNPQRNSVSTAYDPSTNRFLIAYECIDSDHIQVIALPVAPCGNMADCTKVSTTVTGVYAAETPVIACGDENYINPDGSIQLYSNCRLVYAKRNVLGQPIAWRLLGLVPDWNPFQPPGPPGFWIDQEHVTAIESDHAPAVAWFGDRFYMMISVANDSLFETYTQRSSDSYPVYGGTFNPSPSGSQAWVSPPFLSATRYCTPGCVDQLHMFWLNYAVPQCAATGSPSPCTL